jgi:DNA-binding response OmpR family regulator
VTYDVLKVISGRYDGRQLVLRFDGGVLDVDFNQLKKTLGPASPTVTQVSRMEMADAPKFKAGDHVLLFTSGNGREASPIAGFNQGILLFDLDPVSGARRVRDRSGQEISLGERGELVFLPSPHARAQAPRVSFGAVSDDPAIEKLRRQEQERLSDNYQRKLKQTEALSPGTFEALVQARAKAMGVQGHDFKSVDPKEEISPRTIEPVASPEELGAKDAKAGSRPRSQRPLVGLMGLAAAELLDYKALFERMGYKVGLLEPGQSLGAMVRKMEVQALVFRANTLAAREAQSLRRAVKTRGMALVTIASVAQGLQWACRKGVVDHFVTSSDPAATVEAVSQVLNGRGLRDPSLEKITNGQVSLDLKHRLARTGGAAIPLSPGEFNLLARLMETSPRTQSWSRLLSELRPAPDPCSPRESLRILRRDFEGLRERLGEMGEFLERSQVGLRLIGTRQ